MRTSFPPIDVETCTRHFQRMAEGKLKRNHNGHYVIEKIEPSEEQKSTSPTIKFVTPVAQAVEMAKSELKRKRKSPRLHGTPSNVSDRKTPRLHGPPGYQD